MKNMQKMENNKTILGLLDKIEKNAHTLTAKNAFKAIQNIVLYEILIYSLHKRHDLFHLLEFMLHNLYQQ